MGIIKQLSEEVVAKIAAGEVIERPAFAVKELIENSLDSGAKNIRISIAEGGLKKIIITDDGRGMSKEDVLLSFLPHTTSKISTSDDLTAVQTLGFRGEALSSIAAISELIIRSKTANSRRGLEVIVSNSRVKSIRPIGMPQGTQVIVEKLFASVPARKKFLKSLRTEYRHILDSVVALALAHPKVSFEFLNNNELVFLLPKDQKIEDRISVLLGEYVATHLLPIKIRESYVMIDGFISRPQISNPSTNKLFITLNNRPIYDPLINTAIRDAYANLLEPKSFPAAIIYVTLPPQIIDVNIHPRKELVSYTDQNFIYQTTEQGVKKVLDTHNLTFHNLSWKNAQTSSFAAKLLKEEIREELSKIQKSADIAQLHNLYLITQSKNGVVFIDQHAAHEAILFRKLSESFSKKRKNKHQVEISPPQLLHLTLSEKEMILENLIQLNKLGFEIEEFGDGNLLVTKSHPLFQDRDIEEIIKEVLADLSSSREPKEFDKKTYRMLATLACRSAIKQGQKLSKSETRELLSQLEETDFAYTCPHGRPVKLELSLEQINRLFKRS